MDPTEQLSKIRIALSSHLTPPQVNQALGAIKIALRSKHYRPQVLRRSTQVIVILGAPAQAPRLGAVSSTVEYRVAADLVQSMPIIIERPSDSSLRAFEEEIKHSEKIRTSFDRYTILKKRIRYAAILVVVLGFTYPFYSKPLFDSPFELSTSDYLGPILLTSLAAIGIEAFARAVGSFSQKGGQDDTSDILQTKREITQKILKHIHSTMAESDHRQQPIAVITGRHFVDGITQTLCHREKFEKLL